MRYYVFRLAGFLCPLLPVSLGYWLFARAADLAFLFAGSHLKTYFENLRHVLGPDASPAEVRAVARRGFQNLLKNYFDLFRGHAVTRARLQNQLNAVYGLDHLEHALQECKGVIAGSAHFGTWDLILNLAPMYLNTPTVVPNERLKPEKLFQYILNLRRAQGIEVVPLDLAPRLLVKTLRAGHIAGLAFDRDITHTGPHVNFFGESTQMPDGAVQLALKYGAPVVMGFSVRQPNNGSVVYIEPPIHFESTGNMKSDVCAGVQKMASIMEKYIRQYPDQWLMFQKIW